ncbi:2-C-methyl-D-erythritol 2,4-cyclodiphosphate synthase [Candidatus Omnitrophota bacterium]
MRIGIGYDLHKIEEGRRLFLGGVEIPSERGAIAHSDGDVLLHAICDAVLGACALGDIGKYFPDTSEKYKDIKSLKLLKETVVLATESGLKKIINVDTVVVCDEPKLAPYIEEMKKTISEVLEISIGAVGIKATTSEGTAPGVASSYAVILIEKA